MKEDLPGAQAFTLGYDYFDYLDCFNHDTSLSDASSEEVPEMKTCMQRMPWRRRSTCQEGLGDEDLNDEKALETKVCMPRRP